MSWIRPENIEHPIIWSKFEGTKIKEDGTREKFVIKDLTPEYYDITLGYMSNIFLRESAICKALNIMDDEQARVQMQGTWLNIMNARTAIICVTDGPFERVAGIHMTMMREKNKQRPKDPSDKFNTFSVVVEDIKNDGQMFEKFNVDHYLGSLGLFVLPEYRGQGIAQHMLKTREEMCRRFGLRGTANVFSTAAAQAAASRAGYVTIARRSIEELSRNYSLNIDHDMALMGKAVDLTH